MLRHMYSYVSENLEKQIAANMVMRIVCVPMRADVSRLINLICEFLIYYEYFTVIIVCVCICDFECACVCVYIHTARA